jgi:hypothetical protein
LTIWLEYHAPKETGKLNPLLNHVELQFGDEQRIKAIAQAKNLPGRVVL